MSFKNSDLNLKKMNISFGIFGVMVMLFAAGCAPQPKNQLAQQQHYICKSLIEGFLKAGSLGQYELQHFQPALNNVVTQRYYTYRVKGDYQMKLNIPKQNKLNFQCQHDQAQHYVVQILSPDSSNIQQIIQFKLPSKQVMHQLTAFRLNHPN